MSKDNKIVGRECRFAVYCPPTRDNNDDLHVIKEVLHYDDGTTKPNLRFVKSYRRPYWVTKVGFRNHKQKKEYEEISKLNRYESTQTDLIHNISRTVEQPYFRGSLRKLCQNPYIYGADIQSTAMIKKTYLDKFPTLNTPYSMAVYDIETDVVRGTKDIIMATLSMKDRVLTVVQKSFVEGYSNVEERLQQLMEKYIGEHVAKRKIKWELKFVDSESEVVSTIFHRAHEWMPDWLAIWNMDFDIPRSVEALEKAGIDPKSVFSDPSVPEEFKFFRYKQGPKQKVTASGKVDPIKPAARWHTVFCPSSFYVIDAMCAYKHIRNNVEPEEPSYGLDAILKKHELGGKLKFTEADKYTKLEWHQFMQDRYPLEYIIYNVFDCVSMEILDEVTSDLSIKLPSASDLSDFENFKSQPRRLVDKLHYFYQEHGKVIATTSDAMADELDSLTMSNNDWIDYGPLFK